MSDRAPMDIGGGVVLTLRDCECASPDCDHSRPCGMTFAHRKPSGEQCDGGGWLYFDHAFRDGWKLEVIEPLTVSPSLHCTRCGRHGFVREGKWVEA